MAMILGFFLLEDPAELMFCLNSNTSHLKNKYILVGFSL